MLDKHFDAAAAEAALYEAWERSGGMAAGRPGTGAPYTIMMPPPNVTGSLHIGHALTFTLQDVLTRWRRMQGRDALWQPGTDHAGIATQMVVERQLGAQGISRHQLGRETFLSRVWEWKAESGGTIFRQLRRLGASPDWGREAFTMDEGLSRAVAKVFVRLHREGLIYRDNRLVNWDTKLLTAISDLEVEQKEVDGNLWHFRYPLQDDPSRFVTVATTRPETMLGDTAVAVNPEDERYRDLIGKFVLLPLVGRAIPIVGDDYADPETGSGAVKITPAHDFNDFEVGRRHNLPMIAVLDREGRIAGDVPEAYLGLDRAEARKQVVADLDALGLVEKIEPHRHTVPHGDRSGTVIEPYLTEQWYVDAATLAKPALEAVETGRTEFVPRQWQNTYFEWMRNIQPWCVSRQLWWGHRIPVWYGPDGTVFCEETEAEALAAAARHYGADTALERDPDVLDTWFSSALWPFSTLGWPDETPELARYYPTDVLVTGFDIIFFWVARMMMMGLHFMGEVPFRTVYIHALVRDEKGQKMSKSKGNVIDPLTLIDSYGADALRFTLTAMAAQGRDIKLATSRVEGYRNFSTKLWNAARYCEMNGCPIGDGLDPATLQQPVNRWIVGSLAAAVGACNEALELYRFNDAADALYRFTWGSFCDWYLEFTKPLLAEGADAAVRAETQATAGFVLHTLLHALHPIMPFVTEQLHAHFTGQPMGALMTARWPDLSALPRDTAAEAEMDWLVDTIGAIRGTRAEMNVPPGARMPLSVRGASDTTRARLAAHEELLFRMARLSELHHVDAAPAGSAQAVVGEATLFLPVADFIDLDKERQRLAKQLKDVDGKLRQLDAKLSDERFLAKAPEDVVDAKRQERDEAAGLQVKLNEALARLQAA